MKLRPVAIYTTLFIAAFAFSLAWLILRDDVGGPLRTAVTRTTGMLSPWNGDSDPAPLAAGTEARPAARRSNDDDHRFLPGFGMPTAMDAAEPQEDALEARQRQLMISRVAEVSVQATSGTNTVSRGEALDQLGDVATPEVVQALDIAATSDQDPRNRIRAITALQRLAMQPEATTQALSILQRAVNDPHPAVASRARVAQQEILGQGQDPVAPEG